MTAPARKAESQDTDPLPEPIRAMLVAWAKSDAERDHRIQERKEAKEVSE